MQRTLLWISLFLVSFSPALQAQFENGAVLGTIRDASQAVIPGAAVTLTSVNTGVERLAQTNDVGNYQFLNISPGQYQVQATSTGFKSSVSDIFTVVVGARQRADLNLEVGEASETIEVVGAAPLIETDSSDRGTVISNKTAVDLPLNGRSYADLTLLTPGTSQSLRGALAGRDASYHVNGLRSSFNNFQLDGVDNNHYGTSNQGFSSQAVQLSPDAVGEFKVVTNNYSAEYGRAGGAIINAAYRSGTNEYHATAWNFLRNTDLNAVGFFQPQFGKPQFNQNQFGVAGGGPIVKNRAFFFADYEGRIRRQSELSFASVATDEVRQGIIGAPIVDPLTGDPYSNAGGGDVVPESRRQFYAGRLFQDLPSPNRPGINNNFESLPSERQDDHKGNIKGDFYINDKLTAFGRYSHRELEWLDPDEIPGPSGGDSNGDVFARNLGFVGGTTWSMNATSVLEVRVGFTHSRGGKLPTTFDGPPTGETYQIPNVVNDPAVGGGAPATSVGGFSQMGRQRSNPQFQDPDVVNPRVNYSKIYSNHTFKLGWESQFIHTNINDLGPTLPNFRFTGRFSDGGNRPAGFNANMYNWADYWVGAQSELQLAVNDTLQYRQRMHFGYFQDDWKVNQRLTLNLGLRYELGTPQWEKNNNLGNFDPSNNSLVLARDGSIFDRALVELDNDNFAPRLGAAYQIDRKTVVRGAFGMSYIHFNRMGGENILGFTGPFIFRVNKTQSAPRFQGSGGLPVCTDLTDFRNCFILAQQGVPSNFVSPDQYDPSITRVNMQPFDNEAGWVQTWHFTIQRQFGKDWALDVGYVGNRGRNQLVLGDFNQARPAAPGENLPIDDRRPIEDFSFIQTAFSGGNTSYNSLQAKLEKRFGDGLYVLNAFTWSKAIDNGPGHLETFNGDSSRLNIRNLESERGLSSYDTPYNNVTSIIWDIPFGRGRLYGGSINPVVNAFLGGWRTTLINTMRTGYPIHVRYSPPANLQTCSGCRYRPNYLGGQLVNDDRPIDNFFNQAALQELDINSPGQPFGNLGRNVARTHSFYQADFGLFKEFPLPREGSRVEFRSEFFNLFNRTNFREPNQDLSNDNFGRIFNTFPARQIQFALKLYW